MSSYYNKTSGTDKDLWRTPEDLAALVTSFARKVGFEGITLDPATTRENPMGAEYIRTPECDPDGLTTQWFSLLEAKPCFCYVNPPYRAEWYKKIVLEAVRRPHTLAPSHMIALLPAKPGTAYFQEIAEHMDAGLFIRGRLTFRGAAECAPFESALAYFGPSKHAFRAHFEEIGWAV